MSCLKKKILFDVRTTGTNEKNVSLGQKVIFFCFTSTFQGRKSPPRARARSQNFFLSNPISILTIYNKNSINFGTRDIGKLAENKPKLIERVINKATKNVLRCFELAAGAQRTHDEIEARKKSQTNPECPALANPNYVEAD